MRKTNAGYSISVFVGDGEVARALRLGIDRFFEKLEAEMHPVNQKTLIDDVNDEMEVLKNATRVS